MYIMRSNGKYFGVLAVALLMLVSCEKNQDGEESIQSDGLKNSIVELDYEYFTEPYEFEYCKAKEFKFESSANVTIFNDDDYIYVRVTADENWIINYVSINIIQGSDPITEYDFLNFPYQFGDLEDTSNREDVVIFKLSYSGTLTGCLTFNIKIRTLTDDDHYQKWWVEEGESRDLEYCLGQCENTCVVERDIIAGQHTTVGTLVVTDVNGMLYIKYDIDEPYTLDDAHLFVGCFEDLPLNKPGNPKIGKFPYHLEDMNEGGYFVIDKDDIDLEDCECFIIAAHAVVSMYENEKQWQETAWSEGVEFVEDRNWGTYSVDTDCWCTENGED